ncbi:hypothetical protein FMEAI12_6790005 [Parafrankia sp. Ea1.12]|nr:hypothetical protein FMEAI12_6790005 [Parafrankia sp. Ea1.12]
MPLGRAVDVTNTGFIAVRTHERTGIDVTSHIHEFSIDRDAGIASLGSVDRPRNAFQQPEVQAGSGPCPARLMARKLVSGVGAWARRPSVLMTANVTAEGAKDHGHRRTSADTRPLVSGRGGRPRT